MKIIPKIVVVNVSIVGTIRLMVLWLTYVTNTVNPLVKVGIESRLKASVLWSRCLRILVQSVLIKVNTTCIRECFVIVLAPAGLVGVRSMRA